MSERVAVVDLGSNAVRFVLARIRPGVEFRVLREERVQTRLAAGRAGTLPRIAVRDTLTAMREFLSDVHERETPRVLAVASAAVRDATNGNELVDAVRRQTGVELRVLSGEEEAWLGAIAALWSGCHGTWITASRSRSRCPSPCCRTISGASSTSSSPTR